MNKLILIVVAFLMLATVNNANATSSQNIVLEIVKFDRDTFSFVDINEKPRMEVLCSAFGRCGWIHYITSSGADLGEIDGLSAHGHGTDPNIEAQIVKLAELAKRASPKCPLKIYLKIVNNLNVNYVKTEIPRCLLD